MNRKWLSSFAACALLGGFTFLHARPEPQSASPATEPPQTRSGGAFFLQLDGSVPPPGELPSGEGVFFLEPDAKLALPLESFDIAAAAPEFAPPLPFPPDPQGGTPVVVSTFVGPDPQDNIAFVGFEAGLGSQTVTGAPYCAQVTSEFTQTLQDGNKIERKNVATVCRDGQGRTRREQTLPAIGQYAASSNPPPRAIFINDPVANVSYVLDPVRKTARKMVLKIGRAPGGNPPQNDAGRRNGPDRNNGPRRDSDVSTESLGTMNIEGILVQGTRITRTIPAGKVGNQAPIQITSERWYSPDLRLNLLVKNNDPMRGQNTTTVTNINRSEPDPSLFQVPAGYTIIEPRILRRNGPGSSRP